MLHEKSNCCKEKVIVSANPKHYYVCAKCWKSCELFFIEGRQLKVVDNFSLKREIQYLYHKDN